MVPIYRKPYDDGELLLGWPTWDPTGKDGKMSVKYSYKLKSGRPSRGAPEVPIRIAVDMIIFAGEYNQLTQDEIKRLQKMLNQLSKR